MKIIILHGDDTQKSYLRLTKFIDEAKKRNWEILYDEVSATPSLFGVERLIVIRDIKLLTKKILNTLSKIPGTLVVYETSSIGQTVLKTFPKESKVEKYDLPKIIWNFLDTLQLSTLHELIKNEPIEFIFALISKRIRDLYWIKIDSKSLPYQSWQVSKLKKQSDKYTEGELKIILEELARIDVEVKTGKTDLTSSLDLLFVKYIH